jgi:formylglycine-generating enzyme required for sulfatase activity
MSVVRLIHSVVRVLAALMGCAAGVAGGQSVYEAPATFSLVLNGRSGTKLTPVRTLTHASVLTGAAREGGSLVATTNGAEFGSIRFVARGKQTGQEDLELGDAFVIEALGSSRVGAKIVPASVPPVRDTQLGVSTLVREVRVRISEGLQGEADLGGTLTVRCRAIQPAGKTTVEWVPEAASTLRATGFYSDGVADGPATCALTMTFRAFARSARVPAIVQQSDRVYAESGRGFSLGVTPSGTGPFTFQWLKDGVEISGAVNSSYTVASADVGSAGSYMVRVGNAFGTTLSTAGVVSVDALPRVTSQPTAVDVTERAAFRLSVGAAGSGALSYQWEKDGVPIFGADTPVYEVGLASQGDAGAYLVRVTSVYGSTVSSSVSVRVSTGQGGFQKGPEANGHETVVIAGGRVAFGVRETTVGQWKAFVAAQPDVTSSLWMTPFSDFSQPDTHPVVNVTWNEAQRYCAWLTQVSGRVWRLPTDAEWLVAAGSGTYPWTLPLSRRDKAGNYAEQNDGYAYTSPGGMFAVNSRGLYDMGGNVWEWVGDLAAGGDPGRRIFRGGSYTIWDPEFMKTSAWASGAPSASFIDVGFRVVCELTPTILSTTPAGGAVSLPVGGVQELSVTAASVLPVTYQWYKDGVLIQGATGAVYSVGPVGGRSAGRYTVRVRSSAGFTDSAAIQVGVSGLLMNGHEVLGVRGLPVAMGKSETTVSQWRNFVASAGWVKSSDWAAPMYGGASLGQTDTHPVVNVSWDDARDYCAWLSEQTGLTWRLPVESEWNVAVGASRYPWGVQWPPLARFGNLNLTAAGGSAFPAGGVDAVKFTSPVGMFGLTASGFYDLAGNVSEWVGEESYGGDGTLRGIRGSSWMTDSEGECASMFRVGAPRGARSAAVGFRVVVETLPRISKQPTNARSDALDADVLSVTARSFSGSLTYQWLLNGVAVVGAIGETYTVPAGNGGAYQVRVSNDVGTVVSNPVYVTR